MESLKSLLEEQIKDLYSAENQLVKALPKMAKAATSKRLKQAIEQHLEETQTQVQRLTQIAELLGTKPGGKKCKGMEGLIAEGKEAMESGGDQPLVDLAIIAGAQKVEHYEISGYGTARAIAQELGETQVVELLEETLREEEATDEKLTQVTRQYVMPYASHEGAQA